MKKKNLGSQNPSLLYTAGTEPNQTKPNQTKRHQTTPSLTSDSSQIIPVEPRIALAREAKQVQCKTRMQGHPTASPMGHGLAAPGRKVSESGRGHRKRPTHAPIGGYEELKMSESLAWYCSFSQLALGDLALMEYSVA
ncbi:hypothetical protein N7509_013064 [Penicillium cosmopolitanum]|uniref:Uncharacterized protein n=1 Tax=Penicillium cosmopolitanum TaxID=1131564 RepID=A0A9W9VBN2_9EURO|nr:uncharacterized protein N7509_013064 [Penicillium cosmopolitanum]KAJ5376178.1 hypothetical protein N7509_013064 [Penicillium cosmopolitanum]